MRPGHSRLQDLFLRDGERFTLHCKGEMGTARPASQMWMRQIRRVKLFLAARVFIKKALEGSRCFPDLSFVLCC